MQGLRSRRMYPDVEWFFVPSGIAILAFGVVNLLTGFGAFLDSVASFDGFPYAEFGWIHAFTAGLILLNQVVFWIGSGLRDLGRKLVFALALTASALEFLSAAAFMSGARPIPAWVLWIPVFDVVLFAAAAICMVKFTKDDGLGPL